MACSDCGFKGDNVKLPLVHCVLFDEVVSLCNSCFMDSENTNGDD